MSFLTLTHFLFVWNMHFSVQCMMVKLTMMNLTHLNYRPISCDENVILSKCRFARGIYQNYHTTNNNMLILIDLPCNGYTRILQKESWLVAEITKCQNKPEVVESRWFSGRIVIPDAAAHTVCFRVTPTPARLRSPWLVREGLQIVLALNVLWWRWQVCYGDELVPLRWSRARM